VDIGNEWILVRFATVDDRNLVYNNRPWLVNGLNFILTPWIPFFDPFSNAIDKVNQWICIPRLPCEFWDQGSLVLLLSCVGHVVRVDYNTLFRVIGKFGKVCVKIDVTQPLPGSLTISMNG